MKIIAFESSVLQSPGLYKYPGHLTYRTDKSKIPFSPEATYLVALANFNGLREDFQPGQVLRTLPRLFMRCVTFTAVLEIEEVVAHQLKDCSDLTIVSSDAETAHVITGTFDKWFDLITENTTPSVKFQLRFLLDTFLLIFEKFGLGEVFGQWKKKELQDKTFYLERCP